MVYCASGRSMYLRFVPSRKCPSYPEQNTAAPWVGAVATLRTGTRDKPGSALHTRFKRLTVT